MQSGQSAPASTSYAVEGAADNRAGGERVGSSAQASSSGMLRAVGLANSPGYAAGRVMSPRSKLKLAAAEFIAADKLPSILRKRKPGEALEASLESLAGAVLSHDECLEAGVLLGDRRDDGEKKPGELSGRQAVHKVNKISKHKGVGSGRTYTSRFRGVHQTFPTRRWEAQFRKAGKPTSLGCFDREEEAARAYDKMMLWCDLHHKNGPGCKSGVTNFDLEEYVSDIPTLEKMTQDELVQSLRRDGRTQAAAKSPGAPPSSSGDPASSEDDGEGGTGGGRGGGSVLVPGGGGGAGVAAVAKAGAHAAANAAASAALGSGGGESRIPDGPPTAGSALEELRQRHMVVGRPAKMARRVQAEEAEDEGTAALLGMAAAHG